MEFIVKIIKTRCIYLKVITQSSVCPQNAIKFMKNIKTEFSFRAQYKLYDLLNVTLKR